MQAVRAFPAVQGSLLVVEDDQELAGLLEEVLVTSGYDVIIKHSTHDAMERLDAQPKVVAAILDV